MVKIALIAVSTVIFSLVLDGILIHHRRPKAGFLVGLIPILAHELIYIIPRLTCHSDNPIGCEWAGIGVVLFSGITLEILLAYSLLSVGLARAYPSIHEFGTGQLTRWKSIALSFRSVGTLLTLAIVGAIISLLVLTLVNMGIFASWQNLGTPPDVGGQPEEKAIKIISYGLNSIQIETNLGRRLKTDFEHLDYCSSQKKNNTNCWYQSADQPEYIPRNPNCKIAFWIQDPPDLAVDRVEVLDCTGWSKTQTVFILSPVGRVWAWHFSGGSDPFDKHFAIAPGAVAGMVLGIWVVGRRKFHSDNGIKK